VDGRLPDFIIIGAMKCGTTNLHDQLVRRSSLFMSRPKEPNFFSDDEAVANRLGAYKKLFSGARPDQLCGESSTHYTKLPTYPGTVRHMRALVPNAKLIYIMRDPLARIVSQYMHEWTRGEINDDISSTLLRHDRFVAYSSYAQQLRPFLEYWGGENVLPICFERMTKHPTEVLSRVCSFLGDPSPEPVTWDPTAEKNVSQGRLRKSAVREAILAIPPMRAVKDSLPESVRDWLKAPWQMRERPELTGRILAEIEGRLDADLATLGHWLGLELTCRTWLNAAQAPLAWTTELPASTTYSVQPRAAGEPVAR